MLDNWRSFYVEGAPALAENLRELTYGVPAPLEEADYLFFPRMGEPGPVIEKAKPGTLPEPHKSATLFLLTDSLTGGEAFSLTGPGVEGAVTVTLPAPCRPGWKSGRHRRSSSLRGGFILPHPPGPGYGDSPQGEDRR